MSTFCWKFVICRTPLINPSLLASGDRTPKQKVKLKVTEEKLLNLMLKYNGGRPRAEVLIYYLCTIILLTFEFYPSNMCHLVDCLTSLSHFYADKAQKCRPIAGFAGCNTYFSTSF